MAFLDKITEIAKNIGDKTTEIAKNIGEKTNEVVESTRLNSKINTEKEEIKKNIYQIGEYYQKKLEGGSVPEEVKPFFDAITASQTQIAQYEKDIEDQKFEGSVFATTDKPVEGAPHTEKKIICPRCGTKNDPLNKFCSHCGASLEGIEPVDVSEAPESVPVDAVSEGIHTQSSAAQEDTPADKQPKEN